MVDSEIDWDFYGGIKEGRNVKRSKESFIDFFRIVKMNKHELLSKYTKNTEKVLIDFKCGHEPSYIIAKNYKNGARCLRCAGCSPQQALEDFFNLIKKNNHRLLSEYINVGTKVLIDFKCGHKPSYISPALYKKGSGCKECSGQGLEEAKKRFIKKVKENNHILIGEYKNAHTKVLIDFKCGHNPHKIKPNSYNNGSGCPECGLVKKQEKLSEKSREAFKKLVNNNGHILLSDYINNKSKVLIDFKCGHNPHKITPSEYNMGGRCPKCQNRCPIQAKEKFEKLIKTKGHVLLSEYINVNTKVLIDFKCGHEPNWIVPPSYQNGRGCPKCGNKRKNILASAKAKEEFMNLVESNGHLLLSEYTKALKKVSIDFKCGHKPHLITPNDYKTGYGCPICKASKGEQKCSEILDCLGIKYEREKTFNDLRYNGILKLDFYIEKFNIVIEINGEQHYKPHKFFGGVKGFKYNVERDNIKRKYCAQNNLKLLEIPYNGMEYDLNFIEKVLIEYFNDIKK